MWSNPLKFEEFRRTIACLARPLTKVRRKAKIYLLFVWLRKSCLQIAQHAHMTTNLDITIQLFLFYYIFICSNILRFYFDFLCSQISAREDKQFCLENALVYCTLEVARVKFLMWQSAKIDSAILYRVSSIFRYICRYYSNMP